MSACVMGAGGAGKRPSLMLPVSLLLHKIAITKLIINSNTIQSCRLNNNADFLRLPPSRGNTREKIGPCDPRVENV